MNELEKMILGKRRDSFMSRVTYKRICGRKKRRIEMTKKELKYAIIWCKSEIVKLQKELEKK